MFKVREIKTGAVRTVYAVQGGLFLMYEAGVWFWDHIQKYEPIEE